MEGQELDINSIDYSKYTICIVDDSPLVISSLSDVLVPMNYTVHSSTNGKEALEAIHKNTPDLIILDVEMPVMDGYEATRNIKNDNRLKRIPVIGLSSSAMDEDKIKGFESGMDHYLEKPLNRDHLFQVLDRIMKRNLKKSS